MKKNEILTTSNYDMFTLHPNNRPINSMRVSRRMKVIEQLDLTHLKPVVINEKNQIIDGQHNFMACKELGKPIYYVRGQLNGKSNDAMSMLNANQTQWDNISWISHWANRGKEYYSTIVECMEKHKIGPSLAMIYVGQMSGGGRPKDFKEGKFTKGTMHYNKIAEIHADFIAIFPQASNSLFTKALVGLIKTKKYDHATEFHKFEKNKYGLQLCATIEQYYRMFETIINKHRRGAKLHIQE